MFSFAPLLLYRWGKSPQGAMEKGSVGPGASLDTVERGEIMHCWELNLGSPACSPLVYF
jgi:hypothetical protein